MRTVNPEQHARKRALILDAAAQEFAAGGMAGASTAGICQRAGISSGTLFHYFPTKRDIFHALFEDALSRNGEVCERALACDQARTGLHIMVAHLVSDLADPLAPGLMAACLIQESRDEDFAKLLGNDSGRTRNTLANLLSRMANQGTHLAFPPQRAARWIQGLIDAALLTAGDHDFDPAVEAADLQRLISWLVDGRP